MKIIRVILSLFQKYKQHKKLKERLKKIRERDPFIYD